MYTNYFLSHDPIKIVELKKYSNKLNQNKNISKKTYFSMHFEMCKSNLKATWKLIGTLIKRKTESQSIPLRIDRNDKIYIPIMKILQISLINMAQTWPVKLTKAMKILHSISRHLQLTVLLWKMSQKLRFLTCSKT